MINYTEPMDEDDFNKVADSIEIDWDPEIYPNATDATHGPTTETPEPIKNGTKAADPEEIIDIYKTDGFGLHFIGMPFGANNQIWFMMLWVRRESRVSQEWVLLDFDPSDEMHKYQLQVQE